MTMATAFALALLLVGILATLCECPKVSAALILGAVLFPVFFA